MSYKSFLTLAMITTFMFTAWSKRINTPALAYNSEPPFSVNKTSGRFPASSNAQTVNMISLSNEFQQDAEIISNKLILKAIDLIESYSEETIKQIFQNEADRLSMIQKQGNSLPKSTNSLIKNYEEAIKNSLSRNNLKKEINTFLVQSWENIKNSTRKKMVSTQKINFLIKQSTTFPYRILFNQETSELTDIIDNGRTLHSYAWFNNSSSNSHMILLTMYLYNNVNKGGKEVGGLFPIIEIDYLATAICSIHEEKLSNLEKRFCFNLSKLKYSIESSETP